MIDLKGKGISRALFDQIELAGHWLHIVDGKPVASDDAAVQSIIDGFALDDAKSERYGEVMAYSKLLRERVTASVAPGEMASWTIKRDEALDYGKVGELATCPALRAEANARGVTLAQLVAKVNANAARFMAAEAAIAGTDGKHRDKINAMTTFAAVATYDITTNWPEV